MSRQDQRTSEQVKALQARCSTLENRVQEQESELSRAHEAHRLEMQGIAENQRRLVAEAERKQAQMVTQQITSQMQTQYERVRTEHSQSQQTIVRLQAELAQSRKENQTLTQTVQSLEVSQSAAAVQKVQSNLVGASQEEFLMSTLMDTFPFARVEDCSRTPKNMDIRLFVRPNERTNERKKDSHLLGPLSKMGRMKMAALALPHHYHNRIEQ